MTRPNFDGGRGQAKGKGRRFDLAGWPPYRPALMKIVTKVLKKAHAPSPLPAAVGFRARNYLPMIAKWVGSGQYRQAAKASATLSDPGPLLPVSLIRPQSLVDRNPPPIPRLHSTRNTYENELSRRREKSRSVGAPW